MEPNKLDTLDLILRILLEHEKTMDILVERMEVLADRLEELVDRVEISSEHAAQLR